MELTKTTIIFTIFSLLISLSQSTSVVDFCVADFNFPPSPIGFPCKNPANISVDDFVFSGMNVAGNTSGNIFNIVSTNAIDLTLPGLNGLGLSLLRFDFGVGGVVPMHSHRASELIIVIEGTIIAGFIASDNTAYYKTLNKGDVMIFPPTLLHFQANVGNDPAVAFVSLNTARPNFVTITPSLAANDLATEVIHRVTLLDSQQLTKLKTMFGGSN